MKREEKMGVRTEWRNEGGNTMKEEGPGDHPLYLIYINDFPFEMMHCFCLCEYAYVQFKGVLFHRRSKAGTV